MIFYKPKQYSTQRRRFFAWWPITIGLETRWLEWVTIKEWYRYRWIPIGFVKSKPERIIQESMV